MGPETFLISIPILCACVFEYLLLNVCLILYLKLRMTNKGESWTQQLIWLVGAWSLKQAARLRVGNKFKNTESVQWEKTQIKHSVGKTQIHIQWEKNTNTQLVGKKHKYTIGGKKHKYTKFVAMSLKQLAIPIGWLCFFTTEHKLKMCFCQLEVEKRLLPSRVLHFFFLRAWISLSFLVCTNRCCPILTQYTASSPRGHFLGQLMGPTCQVHLV